MSNHHRIRPFGAVLATAALSVSLLAACGSNDDEPRAGSTGGNGGLLSASSSDLGSVLVTSNGRTVYFYAGDTSPESTCNGACATNWPPVAAPDPVPASLDGVSGTLGSSTRADGVRQLTVNSHPVYTFKGDSAAGEAKGQGKVLDGGLWSVVAPNGTAITAAPEQPDAGNGY